MDNQTAVISIQSIEATDWGCKIQAQDKKVYNVSKKKQDGTQSVAWSQMIDMGLKATDPLTGTLGSTVEIWFREVPNKHGGTSRYIASFRESNGQPTPSSQPVSKTPYKSNSSSTASPGGDAFGRRLAIHGMVNGLLASGIKPEEINVQTLRQLNALENVIDAFLASLAPQPVSNEPVLPVIHRDENDDPISVEDIPF